MVLSRRFFQVGINTRLAKHGGGIEGEGEWQGGGRREEGGGRKINLHTDSLE